MRYRSLGNSFYHFVILSFWRVGPTCCVSVYPHGIRLHNTIDNKAIMTFNAPNENDKKKFVNDVKECIAEVQLMETLRIGGELVLHSRAEAVVRRRYS